MFTVFIITILVAVLVGVMIMCLLILAGSAEANLPGSDLFPSPSSHADEYELEAVLNQGLESPKGLMFPVLGDGRQGDGAPPEALKGSVSRLKYRFHPKTV